MDQETKDIVISMVGRLLNNEQDHLKFLIEKKIEATRNGFDDLAETINGMIDESAKQVEHFKTRLQEYKDHFEDEEVGA